MKLNGAELLISVKNSNGTHKRYTMIEQVSQVLLKKLNKIK